MNKFTPFLILIFLISLITVSTYKLSKKQDVATSSSEADVTNKSGVNFFDVNILLDDFSLKNLYNKSEELTPKTFKNKFTVINFFASWCSTCRAEHDVLLELQRRNLVDVYGIAWHDIEENTKYYLEKYGNPFTKTFVDSKGDLGRIIGIKAIPETLIVNEDGVAVMRFQGNLQEFSIDEIADFLKENN